MYGASADHTFANAATPPDALGLVWSLPANGALGGASAVEENGFVYLADFDTTGPPSGPQLRVYKIVEGNASFFGGWSSFINVVQESGIPQSVARGVPRSLAVSGNLVYVLFTAGNATANREVVIALDAATGAPAWTFNSTQTWTNATPSGTRSAPVLGSGILAFGSQDGNVYALNPSDLTLVWWTPAGAPVQTVPAIVEDLVYVAAGTRLLFLDVQGRTDADDPPLETGGWTGDLLQALDVGSSTVGSPIVLGAHVYLDAGGDLHKIDRIAGGTSWVQPTPHETEATPAFTGDFIVTRRSDGRLYAYRGTGQVEWVRSGVPAGTGGGDLAVADGRVFLSVRSGTTYDLVALNATDGTILFRNTTAARPSMGAPIVAGSKVLVTEGAALHAFRGQPDLTPDKVAMSRGTAAENLVQANVTVTVRNLGDEPVSGVRMQVFDGDPSASGVLIGEFTIGTAERPLEPNAIATFFTADRDWTVKQHDVWVVIDRALTETNDANNARAFPIYVQPGPPPPPIVLGAGPYALALLGGFGVGILVLWFPIQRLRELRRKESEK
jgi:outer membrane protein assembly factor BamB